MQIEDFLTLAAEILETEPEELSLTQSLDDADWDSLANISLIAEMDEKFNATINADTLKKAETLDDIFQLVKQATQG
ncbi:acyl carrier protein [Glutamicibacter bergerei]